jgi:putative DNA primase/helicase
MIPLSELAYALGGRAIGGRVLCPGPGHSPRDRSLSVKLCATAPDGFVVHSFASDDIAACRDHVRERLGIDRQPGRPRPGAAGRPVSTQYRSAAEARRARFVHAQITTIVRGLVPVRGSPGEQYLHEVRGIDCNLIADVIERIDAIGWHPAVFFGEEGHPLNGRYLGCIVGVMTDAITARPTGAISRTYIDNSKKIGKARTLGSPAGVVRLSLDEDVLEGLHLAEGLETALSAMSIGLRPLWATGSTSLLKAFPLLCGIETLSIIADHDVNGAGEKASRFLEVRYRRAGREVHIFRSNQTGDLNDALRANVR